MDDKEKYINGDLETELGWIVEIKRELEKAGDRIAIETTEDFNLNYPYAIDVEDRSYFYPTKSQRERDYQKLMDYLR